LDRFGGSDGDGDRGGFGSGGSDGPGRQRFAVGADREEIALAVLPLEIGAVLAGPDAVFRTPAIVFALFEFKETAAAAGGR